MTYKSNPIHLKEKVQKNKTKIPNISDIIYSPFPNKFLKSFLLLHGKLHTSYLQLQPHPRVVLHHFPTKLLSEYFVNFRKTLKRRRVWLCECVILQKVVISNSGKKARVFFVKDGMTTTTTIIIFVCILWFMTVLWVTPSVNEELSV